MKILFVDNALEGHYISYLEALVSLADDCTVLVSGNVQFDRSIKIYNFDRNPALEQGKKNFDIIKYLSWLRLIKKTAQQEQVDIIHFLTGDNLMKYFGIGLDMLKPYKVIVTFHHFQYEKLKVLSRRKIFQKINYGIVHTGTLQQMAKSEGIYNCAQIEYPQFHALNQIPSLECRRYFGIPCDGVPVIAAVGSTRFDKGLDILLAALQKVTEPFYLLIAGKEDCFDCAFIQSRSSKYKGQVFICLKYLTDDEMSMALNAASIIVLPYRKIFDGASGPLADAAILGKAIVGPNHGSLGQIIEKNHLGITFEAENVQDLSEAIQEILISGFTPDKVTSAYKDRLDPAFFQKRYTEVYRSVCSSTSV